MRFPPLRLPFQVEQFRLPPLGDKVEVKVEYGGVNFADLYTRQGLMHNKELPFVLGMECVGTVSAIGEARTDLKVRPTPDAAPIIQCISGGATRDLLRLSLRHVQGGCQGESRQVLPLARPHQYGRGRWSLCQLLDRLLFADRAREFEKGRNRVDIVLRG
jgi:hypothetical protein